jgi:hypothetical protein
MGDVVGGPGPALVEVPHGPSRVPRCELELEDAFSQVGQRVLARHRSSLDCSVYLIFEIQGWNL